VGDKERSLCGAVMVELVDGFGNRGMNLSEAIKTMLVHRACRGKNSTLPERKPRNALTL
jgi:hypothetical protein